MSHHTSAAAGQEHAHDAAAHGTLKSYLVGFGLSLVLTLLSFGLVMSDAVPHGVALPGIVILCVSQLLVQLVYFLHMGASRSQRDNLATFVFAAFIIAIIVGGSAWVLHNMNANMMHPLPAACNDRRPRAAHTGVCGHPAICGRTWAPVYCGPRC